MRGNVIDITPALTIMVEELQAGLNRLRVALDKAVLGEVTDAEVAAFTGW